MADTAQLMESIKSMTVLELSEFVKQLQEEFGVTAAVPVAAGPVGDGPAPTAEPDVPTSFNVILTGFGEKKLDVIKTVRTLTSLGLKEAKDLVEGVPQPIKEGVGTEEAETLKAALVAAGGTVDIKPAG